MNDRFRFRVWSNTANKYIKEYTRDEDDYEGEMFLSTKGGLVNFYEEYSEEFYVDYDFYKQELVIEQCTGLKDKNERLIYEGDIVELTDYDSFEKPIKTIVRWAEENACFGLFCSHNLYYGFSSYDSDNFEVIGNIHENTALLEGK